MERDERGAKVLEKIKKIEMRQGKREEIDKEIKRRSESLEEKRVEGRGKEEEMELAERIRRMQLESDRKEREEKRIEKRKNFIIKNVRIEEKGVEGIRKAVGKVLESLGVVKKIENVKRLEGEKREGKEKVWVRMEERKER